MLTLNHWRRVKCFSFQLAGAKDDWGLASIKGLKIWGNTTLKAITLESWQALLNKEGGKVLMTNEMM